MKNRTKMIVNVSTLLLAGMAMGAALPAGALGSFGYRYAGFHCSCAGTPGATSASTCSDCCTAAGVGDGPLTVSDVSNCIAFCNECIVTGVPVHFPCLPPDPKNGVNPL